MLRDSTNTSKKIKDAILNNLGGFIDGRNKRIQSKKVDYSKILICVDSDDFVSSKNAFNYACSLARHHDAELGIVSVLETGDLNIFQSLDPEVLKERREQIKNSLKCTVKRPKIMELKIYI
jgi:Universal stress protein family.